MLNVYFKCKHRERIYIASATMGMKCGVDILGTETEQCSHRAREMDKKCFNIIEIMR